MLQRYRLAPSQPCRLVAQISHCGLKRKLTWVPLVLKDRKFNIWLVSFMLSAEVTNLVNQEMHGTPCHYLLLKQITFVNDPVQSSAQHSDIQTFWKDNLSFLHVPFLKIKINPKS